MHDQDDLIHSRSTDWLFWLVDTQFYLSSSFHEPELVSPKKGMAGGSRVRLAPTLDQLAPPVPSSKTIVASCTEPSSLLFTNRTKTFTKTEMNTETPG